MVNARRAIRVAPELWVTKAEGSQIVSWKQIHGRHPFNQNRFDANSPEAFRQAIKAGAEQVMKCEESRQEGQREGEESDS
ncbi:hypothetical protein M427DRAFT_135134 [Gonapodya prolifera JEL478]|uniref:Uncharacterized protein n=1 Tax=Gonapodya prolifera (strain JEL478) TaxID=1344416 RepID=A0A139AF41_GONPJ|nr:hypothetical protein M427DRAFT_135134 [Gonapodya prolifera JEL478]|eukprot:KXS15431.1 hypothetical protein M427DRAFT_135134 [Gonapodya prolifera JEL478]